MEKFSLPKSKRLVSNEQFKAVLAHNISVRDNLFILYTAGNNSNWPRLGISIGKSSGNAVMRNRLKRLVREAFRQSQDQIPPGFDYLVMISPQWLKNTRLSSAAKKQGKQAVNQLTFEQVKTSLLGLINKAVKKIKQK